MINQYLNKNQLNNIDSQNDKTPNCPQARTNTLVAKIQTLIKIIKYHRRNQIFGSNQIVYSDIKNLENLENFELNDMSIEHNNVTS